MWQKKGNLYTMYIHAVTPAVGRRAAGGGEERRKCWSGLHLGIPRSEPVPVLMELALQMAKVYLNKQDYSFDHTNIDNLHVKTLGT